MAAHIGAACRISRQTEGGTVKTGCRILEAFLLRVNTRQTQTLLRVLRSENTQALGQRRGRISALSSCSALCAAA